MSFRGKNWLSPTCIITTLSPSKETESTSVCFSFSFVAELARSSSRAASSNTKAKTLCKWVWERFSISVHLPRKPPKKLGSTTPPWASHEMRMSHIVARSLLGGRRGVWQNSLPLFRLPTNAGALLWDCYCSVSCLQGNISPDASAKGLFWPTTMCRVPQVRETKLALYPT